jgi:hypothetical protein
METWYEVTLTDDDIAAHKHMKLQDEFTALYQVSHPPKDAVMLDNREVIEGHHFYFSPSAVREICHETHCPLGRQAVREASLVRDWAACRSWERTDNSLWI